MVWLAAGWAGRGRAHCPLGFENLPWQCELAFRTCGRYMYSFIYRIDACRTAGGSHRRDRRLLGVRVGSSIGRRAHSNDEEAVVIFRIQGGNVVLKGDRYVTLDFLMIAKAMRWWKQEACLPSRWRRIGFSKFLQVTQCLKLNFSARLR